MAVLLTGGTGYIGTHVASVLLDNGYSVVIVDNLSNSSKDVIAALKSLHSNAILTFIKGDVCDRQLLDEVFSKHQISGVIHLAGYKAVKESVEQPINYYRNNIDSSLTLLEIMAAHNVTKLIFSSSATVYGNEPTPYVESMEIGHGITNPYGQTKFIIEQILQDACLADLKNEFTSLRYFNPIGAHPSGLLGEQPSDIPNNLMPYIQQVASGKLKELHVFGDDYPTPDGTCIRDYVHVMDVAEAHVAALSMQQKGYAAYNIGTGKGTSVIELLKAFEQASNQPVPYVVDDRRDGDLAECYADTSLATARLGWQASRTIEDACRDSWNFINKLMDNRS